MALETFTGAMFFLGNHNARARNVQVHWIPQNTRDPRQILLQIGVGGFVNLGGTLGDGFFICWITFRLQEFQSAPTKAKKIKNKNWTSLQNTPHVNLSVRTISFIDIYVYVNFRHNIWPDALYYHHTEHLEKNSIRAQHLVSDIHTVDMLSFLGIIIFWEAGIKIKSKCGGKCNPTNEKRKALQFFFTMECKFLKSECVLSVWKVKPVCQTMTG